RATCSPPQSAIASIRLRASAPSSGGRGGTGPMAVGTPALAGGQERKRDREGGRHTGRPRRGGEDRRRGRLDQFSLICTSTPAGSSSFISASTVLSVGSRMSIRRLCVRSSYWSRASLSPCGETSTVKRSILVGSGTGPRTVAPVRLAVSTTSLAELSISLWSNAFRRMRMFWLAIFACQGFALPPGGPRSWPASSVENLLQDLRDDAGADGPAALADGEAQPRVHRDRRNQLHRHLHVVAGHHHLNALGQLEIGRA